MTLRSAAPPRYTAKTLRAKIATILASGREYTSNDLANLTKSPIGQVRAAMAIMSRAGLVQSHFHGEFHIRAYRKTQAAE